MLYLKRNLPNRERALRVGLGLALVVAGLGVLHATWLGIGLAAVAVVPIATGVVGFCPGCAAVGRRPLSRGGEPLAHP